LVIADVPLIGRDAGFRGEFLGLGGIAGVVGDRRYAPCLEREAYCRPDAPGSAGNDCHSRHSQASSPDPSPPRVSGRSDTGKAAAYEKPRRSGVLAGQRKRKNSEAELGSDIDRLGILLAVG